MQIVPDAPWVGPSKSKYHAKVVENFDHNQPNKNVPNIKLKQNIKSHKEEIECNIEGQKTPWII